MQGILVYSRSSISLRIKHVKGLLIGLRTVPLCKIRGIEVLKKKMTAYMYLKILVRLHVFESLNIFKILQINDIFSYPSVWNGFWGIVIYFNINFVFFSILFILIYRHYSFFDKMMESCICSQSMQFQHFN